MRNTSTHTEYLPDRYTVWVSIRKYTILSIRVTIVDFWHLQEHSFDHFREHLVELNGAIVVQGVQNSVVAFLES